MGRFVLSDTNQYPLKGTHNRWWHLATILWGFREFIYVLDSWTNNSHVEEITGGVMSKVDDDKLWEALCRFLARHRITYIAEK